MAYLDLETPDGTRRVTIERERLRIGRLATNDVVLAFPQVSRQHAELHHINGQWWITDLGSTNGLQLGPRRIQDHALRDGDRIVLAPGISIRFRDTGAARDPRAAEPGRARSASGPLWEDAPPRTPPEPRPSGLSGAAASSAPTPHAGWDAVPAPAAAPPSGLSSLAGFGAPDSRDPAPDAAAPFALWAAARTSGPAPTVPIDPGESDIYASVARHTSARGGYPVPHGPLHSGAPVGGDDPYRREAPAAETARGTGGPATLLHVCQTCGQRTSASAIYCQHCHNSIASECPNCRLSLLPVQDRCPRCHTPNLHSVRRIHERRTAL